ncbi:ACP S-malonyltransferase [Candidatus Aerophobetes bacterium]|nr:ACP S-malonyltransferase [Candidatus Aerophobetes bacterium]
MKKKRIAFVFPGQGSQYPGMGKDFYQKYPQVKRIFEKANEELNIDLTRICFEGGKELLESTANTQIAVFVVSFASFEVLRNEGVNPDVLGGHSLGEYTALVVSGSLDFLDGLRLVYKRGEFMEEAAQKRPGSMVAIIGLDKEEIAKILRKVEGLGIVVAANFNCPGQIVISGEIETVERVRELAGKAGARKVIPLKVMGAFHSLLMKEAQMRLKKEIEKTNFKVPRIPFIANVNANFIEEPQEIKESLIRQIVSPVLWEDSIRKMAEWGVDAFVEVGPGKVLSGLIRRTLGQKLILNIEDQKSLCKSLKILRET